jgi:hypothetical protein
MRIVCLIALILLSGCGAPAGPAAPTTDGSAATNASQPPRGEDSESLPPVLGSWSTELYSMNCPYTPAAVNGRLEVEFYAGGAFEAVFFCVGERTYFELSTGFVEIRDNQIIRSERDTDPCMGRGSVMDQVWGRIFHQPLSIRFHNPNSLDFFYLDAGAISVPLSLTRSNGSDREDIKVRKNRACHFSTGSHPWVTFDEMPF